MAKKYLLTHQHSARLIFREIQNSDFESWLVFHKDPRAIAHWVAEWQSPEIECQKWYEKQFDRYENNLGGMNALVEKATGRLVGHCGLLVQKVDERSELEIGYSLLPDFWGRGFATEASIKCRDFAFENNFADSLISIISTSNEPSKAVAVRNGMVLEKNTIYNGNKVDIFRITLDAWRKLTL